MTFLPPPSFGLQNRGGVAAMSKIDPMVMKLGKSCYYDERSQSLLLVANLTRGVYNSITFDYFPPPAFDFLPHDASRCVTKSMFFFPINH